MRRGEDVRRRAWRPQGPPFQIELVHYPCSRGIAPYWIEMAFHLSSRTEITSASIIAALIQINAAKAIRKRFEANDLGGVVEMASRGAGVDCRGGLCLGQF